MVEKYRKLLDQKTGGYLQLKKDITDIKKNIKSSKKELKNVETAQVIIQTVAEQTQKQLVYQLTEIVDLALSSVYDDPYEFRLDFIQKRGKTEADIYFVRNGKRRNPMTGSGGGVVDVASFALRLALWSLNNTEKTIIIDEPFKNLDKKRQIKAGEMITLLSKKLGIQFILTSHEDAIINTADKVFDTQLVNKVSVVKEGL